MAIGSKLFQFCRCWQVRWEENGQLGLGNRKTIVMQNNGIQSYSGHRLTKTGQLNIGNGHIFLMEKSA